MPLNEDDKRRIWEVERERTRARLAAQGEIMEAMEKAEVAASHRRALAMLKWTGIIVGALIALALIAVAYDKLFAQQPRSFR